MHDPAHNGHKTPPLAPKPQTPGPISHNACARPSGSLVAFRRDVEDIMAQEILEIPFTEFKESYLPNPKLFTYDLVQNCATALQESSLVTSSHSPFKADSSEKVFNVLLDICKTITEAGVGPPTTTPVYRSTELSTEEDINSFRIGSCFKLLDTTGEFAVNLECRLLHNESDLRENRRRLVDAAMHVMNNDPRRRHTYSISIEDDIMRVWFFSRSHTMRSQGINIIKDYDAVIHILAAFLFASTEELGYDPNIRRHRDDHGDSFFVFRINTRYFKTLSWIYDYQPSHIATRATRVWKAIEIASFEDLTPVHGAVEVVLKDYWLTETSPSERETQNAIFNALENRVASGVPLSSEFEKDFARKIQDVLNTSSWKQHFLTIEVDARDTMPTRSVPTNATVTNTIFDDCHVEPILTDYSDPRARIFAQKSRCQVVYKETCVAIDELEDFGQVVKTMESCLIGSALMFLAEYVHRDISASNLLFYPAAGYGPSGKIGDLEYARLFRPSRALSDPKTGTPFFMSVEIQRRWPYFLPGYFDDETSTDDDTEHSEEDNMAISPDSLYHNFQHDCESYWWLGVWLLYRLRGPDTHAASRIFQNSHHCSDYRWRSFTQKNFLIKDGGGLYDLFPKDLHTCIRKVEQARRKLMGASHHRNKEGRIYDVSAYVKPFNYIYLLIVESLRVISDFPDISLLVTNENAASTPPIIPLKRKHDEDDAYAP